MSLLAIQPSHSPLEPQAILSRLRGCPCLPSLRSINVRLRELLDNEEPLTFQIAELLGRDPSLTESVLHVVNSACYGITRTIKSMEEAVMFLGIRQIRQLVLIAPVIEELQTLVDDTTFPWRSFWQHCLGTALISQELISEVEGREDGMTYLAGLLHDVGTIVIASVFPGHFFGNSKEEQSASLTRRHSCGAGDLRDGPLVDRSAVSATS